MPLPARPPTTAPTAAPTTVPTGPATVPAAAPAAAPPASAPTPVPTGWEPTASGDRVAIGVRAGGGFFHFNLLKSKKTAGAAGTQQQAGSVPRSRHACCSTNALRLPDGPPPARRRCSSSTCSAAGTSPTPTPSRSCREPRCRLHRRLKKRCDRAGVPTVFVNDNRGRWRSDSPASLPEARPPPRPARRSRRSSLRASKDYFVLKPKHSAFFATPLDLLLRHLRVRRLIVSGVAGDQCVLLDGDRGAHAGLRRGRCRRTASARRPRRATRRRCAISKSAHKVKDAASRGLRLVAK